MSFNKTKTGSARPEKCLECEYRSLEFFGGNEEEKIKPSVFIFCRCTCMAGKRPELPAIYPKNFVNLHSYHDSEGAYGRQWIGKMI